MNTLAVISYPFEAILQQVFAKFYQQAETASG